MLSYFTRRRRARLRATPQPESWARILDRNVPLARRMPAADRAELVGHAHVLLAEKHFEGCGGLMLTDDHRVTIAAQAALLLLHRETDYFPRLRSILVYPDAYVVDGEHELEDGIVSEEPEEYSGHTQERLGAVVLSWRDIRADARAPDDGVNLVLHEFAHQLDFEDGEADGVPLHDDVAAARTWGELLATELARLRREVDSGVRTVLDPYGAEDPVEFFAVATETFFEIPADLRAAHPALYDALRRYYRQDPASWPPAANELPF